MKIVLGNDHAGYDLKIAIKEALVNKGYDVLDVGTNSKQSTDYPDYALAASQKVASGEFERGILICGTGIGMCITANKVSGIRAALIFDNEMARLTREHNDSNVLCLGKSHEPEKALQMVDTWLNTAFEGGRHTRRIEKISNFENKR
ncbi:ribose 5-phosphate isomerase B [bacterium]